MKNFLMTVLDTSSKYASLDAVAAGISGMVQSILGTVLTVIGVIAVIYAVYLGVLYAKAESADKRKEVQGRLIGACIGAVIIIVGAVLCFAIDWAGVFNSFGQNYGVSVGS